jgi:hypothetical protein
VACKCVPRMAGSTMAAPRHSPSRPFPSVVTATMFQCTCETSSFIEKTFFKSSSYGKT